MKLVNVYHIFKHSITITIFVFIMMLLVDYLNVLTRGKMYKFIKGGIYRQYTLSSFLGATPGCLGAFMNVSFYMHGLVTIGAITGCMIATSGDEAFVMLTMFPKKAIVLFIFLFILGFLVSYPADLIYKLIFKKRPEKCELSGLHAEDKCRCLTLQEIFENMKKMSFEKFLLIFIFLFAIFGSISNSIGPKGEWEKITFIVLNLIGLYITVTTTNHYLNEHIWNHILKKHLWKIFFWTFTALFFVNLLSKNFDIKQIVEKNKIFVIFIAAILGIIPESGPHLFFVTMFSQGIIPVSVLITSSISQDGHGMLPLYAYSIKDALFVKIFNVAVALIIGIILNAMNL